MEHKEAFYILISLILLFAVLTTDLGIILPAQNIFNNTIDKATSYIQPTLIEYDGASVDYFTARDIVLKYSNTSIVYIDSILVNSIKDIGNLDRSKRYKIKISGVKGLQTLYLTREGETGA